MRVYKSILHALDDLRSGPQYAQRDGLAFILLHICAKLNIPLDEEIGNPFYSVKDKGVK